MPVLVDVDEPQGSGIPPCVPEPGVRPFVWVVWGLLTVTAFGFVARYGTNVPKWDDYLIVGTLIGARPVTLAWLWEQCNEHRIPVPKLILVFADRLAGNDVRAGMHLSVATFAALAAALIRLAERLPGGGCPSDAFFPLLLLSLGHATNFLWSIQFAFVLPTALAIAFLIPIVARASWPGPGIAVMTGVGMVLLALCGVTGLVFVPALALWSLGAAWAEVRSGRAGRARRASALVLSVVPGLTLTVSYFRGFRRGLHPESEGGLIAGVRAAVQFLTGGLGMPTALAWPWSAGVTLALVAIAVVLLGGTWVRRPEERPRVFGLIAFLAGVTALAAAVGWGRGWAGPLAGFQGRYVTMATPFWCWLAFVFRLYAPPALGRLVHNTLFATLCVLLWPNMQAGLEHGREVASRVDALTRDLDAGLPAFQIVKRYTPFLYPNQDEMNRILPLLREARFGPFRSLRDNPAFRETSLPLHPASVSLLRWEGTTAHVTGVDPQITFALPQARYVAGIRIKYSHSNPQGAPARFQLAWKRPGQVGFPDGQRYTNWNLPTGNGQETLVWVDDTLDRFRIQPDNQPCEFRIDQIVLLTSS